VLLCCSLFYFLVRGEQEREEGVVDARDGAAAEADGADGADGVIVGKADVGAGGFFVDGHFGDDGDAHACSDHAEQAAELSTFESDLRMEACAVAGGEGVFTEAVAVAEKKEGLIAQIFQRDGALAGELVIFWKSGEERLGDDWKSFKFVAANGESEKREIDGGGAKALEKDRRDFLDDGDLGLREFSGKIGEMLRQEIRRDGGNDAKRDGTPDEVFLLLKVTAGGFEFPEHRPRARKKGLAHFREAHGAAEAIKEARAEFVFELANLLRERRLGDVALAGGTTEAAGIDDGAEVAELVEFHQTNLIGDLPESHRVSIIRVISAKGLFGA
jgi:hypothetical protein